MSPTRMEELSAAVDGGDGEKHCRVDVGESDGAFAGIRTGSDYLTGEFQCVRANDLMALELILFWRTIGEAQGEFDERVNRSVRSVGPPPFSDVGRVHRVGFSAPDNGSDARIGRCPTDGIGDVGYFLGGGRRCDIESRIGHGNFSRKGRVIMQDENFRHSSFVKPNARGRNSSRALARAVTGVLNFFFFLYHPRNRPFVSDPLDE